MIEIHDALRTSAYGSEFNTEDRGFEKDWDDELFGHALGFHFVENGIEVARARVNLEPQSFDHYPGLKGVAALGEVGLIEVHRDQRNRGIGREAVSLLLARYPGHSFVAYAGKDAEGFWEHIGWKMYVKAEPTESPLFGRIVAS